MHKFTDGIIENIQTKQVEASIKTGVTTTFLEQMQAYTLHFKSVLKAYIHNMRIKPDILKESMSYSLLQGGKRLRPVLMYAVMEMLGGSMAKVDNFAIAMEMVHTYSL